MSVIEEEKILKVILDPRWKVGRLKFDGVEHVFITMQHPEHLNITWLIPRAQARQMGEVLIGMAE
jgi:hypothetical protein